MIGAIWRTTSLIRGRNDAPIVPKPKARWIMASERGLCKDCKWWQIEPKAAIDDHVLGLCIDDDLQPYLLRVSGDCGCNHFMEGEPAPRQGIERRASVCEATAVTVPAQGNQLPKLHPEGYVQSRLALVV